MTGGEVARLLRARLTDDELRELGAQIVWTSGLPVLRRDFCDVLAKVTPPVPREPLEPWVGGK